MTNSNSSPRGRLGTVGLWCALHGESMLSAGLHHLACQLDFDVAQQCLLERKVETMDPFSYRPHLKQAFTEGERWSVSASRIERLYLAGQINEPQRQQFLEAGAIGSHLEVIQRDEGFKGFNQRAVSSIIRRTDPRAG